MWNYLFILDDNDNTQYTLLKTLKESDWVLNSPSGKWTVTPDDKIICQEEVESNKYISPNTNLNACSSVVKRKLVFNKNIVEKSGIHICFSLFNEYLNF